MISPQRRFVILTLLTLSIMAGTSYGLTPMSDWVDGIATNYGTFGSDLLRYTMGIWGPAAYLLLFWDPKLQGFFYYQKKYIEHRPGACISLPKQIGKDTTKYLEAAFLTCLDKIVDLRMQFLLVRLMYEIVCYRQQEDLQMECLHMTIHGELKRCDLPSMPIFTLVPIPLLCWYAYFLHAIIRG